MTGAEHYRKAEELIGKAADPQVGMLEQRRQDTIALAQVHATLAHAAAAAELAANTTEPREISMHGRCQPNGYGFNDYDLPYGDRK